jgi:hypothetical protein
MDKVVVSGSCLLSAEGEDPKGVVLCRGPLVTHGRSTVGQL